MLNTTEEDAKVYTSENLLYQIGIGSKTTYALCCPFKLCEDIIRILLLLLLLILI